ncbi:MAG: HAMP domain-containing sensor histidine kinase [Gaiellaceae bacterium]|jgi:two-component system sensor histidine kinase MprB
MSLRVRLTVVTTAVVAVSVLLASIVVFFSMRSDLLRNVDNELRSRAAAIQSRPFSGGPPIDRSVIGLPAPSFGQLDYFQIVGAGGVIARPRNESKSVPVNARTLAVATGKSVAFYSDTTIGGVHARVLTVPIAKGAALQIASPLDSVDRELARLKLILLLVSLGGIGLALGGGMLVSHTTLVPVRRVTGAAEHVASTLDTSERVPERGKDELGRLAVSFNAMLAALDEAIEMQKRFVADASHELLTPVTSLQTNLEVLARAPRLPAKKRRDLLGDLLGELREVRKLIGNLVELARGKSGERREQVRFDSLVSDCIDQATLRYPDLHFIAELEPATVEGDPERLERAVWNLLENAAKWSESGGLIEIGLSESELTVRDRGPGIPDADKPHVFERFYRAAASRGLPGSGLGLAIVRDVAEAHGGTVEVADAEGGGALLKLKLPSEGRAQPRKASQ